MSNTRRRGEAGGDGEHEPHTEENPAVEAGMSRDIINIPDNVIMDGIKDYSEADQDDILWLFGWARETGVKRSKVCQLLGCDWSTLFKVATGTYAADISRFMTKLRELRGTASKSKPSEFVETLVTRRIEGMLDYAKSGNLDGGYMVMICGTTGRSKTATLLHWQGNNNHGRAIYVDCPESGGLRTLMAEIAKKVGIGTGRKTIDIRDRLFKAFNPRRILILDECARLLPKDRRTIPTTTEFIRRLHDVTHCPIALSVTDVFNEEVSHGAMRGYFEQLVGRIEPLFIPEKVFLDETEVIVRSFTKRTPADDLVKLALDIGNGPGRLRVLFDLLRKARDLAERKKEPMALKHLAAARKLREDRNALWPTK